MIKPQTLGPMLSFLGMAGCRRLWICDDVEKLIHATGQSDNSTWADVVELSFQRLKHNLQTTTSQKPKLDQAILPVCCCIDAPHPSWQAATILSNYTSKVKTLLPRTVSSCLCVPTNVSYYNGTPC